MKNLTNLARKCAPAGKGARIFIKDEANNASGSFKARRAAIAVYHAKKLGYKGVIAATVVTTVLLLHLKQLCKV